MFQTESTDGTVVQNEENKENKENDNNINIDENFIQNKYENDKEYLTEENEENVLMKNLSGKKENNNNANINTNTNTNLINNIV